MKRPNSRTLVLADSFESIDNHLIRNKIKGYNEMIDPFAYCISNQQISFNEIPTINEEEAVKTKMISFLPNTNSNYYSSSNYDYNLQQNHRLILTAHRESEYFSYCRQESLQNHQQVGMDYYSSLFSQPPSKIPRIYATETNLNNKLDTSHHNLTQLTNDYFCSVPGRLSLLSSTCKYKVSISEIHRRISHPECLNASILGGILRRAKSKNGGKQLRERLESIGVRLPAGRRKAATITAFTAMVEGESLQLASDFNSICKNDFPISQCALYVRKRKYEEIDNDSFCRDVKIARNFVEHFVDIVDRQKTHSLPNEQISNEMQSGLTKFDMLTHGFGCPAVSAALHLCIKYLHELETISNNCSNNSALQSPKSSEDIE